MLSYTFNSDGNKWGRTWIFGLATALVVLLCTESFWRLKGYTTTILDNEALWSLERNKIGKSTKEIVLIGSSRIITDISTDTLRRLAPEYKLINLGIDGACANAVLEDLAADETFRGIVICDITPQCFMFGNLGELNAKHFVDFYKKKYNINMEINRVIATLVEESLVTVDKYLSIIKVIGSLIIERNFRPPRYWTTKEDRSQLVDYSMVEIEKVKEKRMLNAKKHYENLKVKVDKAKYLEGVDKVEDAVSKIIKRGGRVVFVHFPVSEEHWKLDEDYFPKKQYWDGFASRTKGEVIHFKEVEELNKFNLPDTSHLDFRDTKEFTSLLFNEMKRRNVL